MRDITAAAKGHATSAWEAMEVELSELFAIFSGKPNYDPAAKHKYGSAYKFKDRLSELEKMGESFFCKNPCQTLEGDFGDIILLAHELAQRRNEIVHSVITALVYERGHRFVENEKQEWYYKYKFYIVPPTYSARKCNELNRPSFLYSSVQINAYSEWFVHVALAAQNLSLRFRDPTYPAYGRNHSLSNV